MAQQGLKLPRFSFLIMNQGAEQNVDLFMCIINYLRTAAQFYRFHFVHRWIDQASEASMQYHPDQVVTLGPEPGQELHHPSGAVTQR